MPPKKKKKNLRKKQLPSTRNKKSKLIKKHSTGSDFLQKNILPFLVMIFKAPFLLINLIVSTTIKIVKNIIFSFWIFIRNIMKLLAGYKDALFGIFFGIISGAIGAVIIFSYLDINSDDSKSENAIIMNTNLARISDIENQVAVAKNQLLEYQNNIKEIRDKLENLENANSNNIITDKENENQIEKLINHSSVTDVQLKSLEKKIHDTTKLMLSSSKSELSNRLYLAQSLIDRLKSGVPYAPQLDALGQEGLNPSLLRYAKGGAPTLDDLTARLSARAGELRDEYKTKNDETWKNSLKDEISKIVKIKPKNSANIKGMEGVLLRAEEAISRGNLIKAITEIDSLDPSDRGVLESWLSEAKAMQNANLAAENLLAKTTAALKKRN